jgi:hypothetical protein
MAQGQSLRDHHVGGRPGNPDDPRTRVSLNVGTRLNKVAAISEALLRAWRKANRRTPVWIPDVSWPFPSWVVRGRPYDWSFDGL